MRDLDGKGRRAAIDDQSGGPDGYCVKPGTWRFVGGYLAVRFGRNGWNIYREGQAARVGWEMTLKAARAWILEQR